MCIRDRDTDVFDEDLVAYSLMSDNYDAGVQCAKDMMKRKKSANIVLLQHSTAYSAVQRIQGFVDTVKDKMCIRDRSMTTAIRKKWYAWQRR